MRRSGRTYAQLSGKTSERVGGGATIGRSVRCNPNRLTFPDVATGIPLSEAICSRNPTSRDTLRGPAGNAIVPVPLWYDSRATTNTERVRRLISRLAAWARIATKSTGRFDSAAESIALARSSFPWMYTAGPEPIRFATDPTPSARPSARLIAPTRTMHANAIARAVARVRRVKRVASRKIGRGMRPPADGWSGPG